MKLNPRRLLLYREIAGASIKACWHRERRSVSRQSEKIWVVLAALAIK